MGDLPKRPIETPQTEIDIQPSTETDNGKANIFKPRVKAATVKEKKLRYSFWIAIGCLAAIILIFIIEYFFKTHNESAHTMAVSVVDIFKTAMLLAMGYLFGNIGKDGM